MSTIDDRSNDLGCKVWLRLLREGGRWACSELAENMSLPRAKLQRILFRMHDIGQVQRFDKPEPGTPVRYGIGPDCKVPRGVAVQDILDCNLTPLKG